MQRNWRRWAALQIAALLPGNRKEATLILRLAQEIVDNLDARHSPAEGGRLRKRRAVSKGTPRGSPR